MTQHITTGPDPGHPGSCKAKYNHHTHSHTYSSYFPQTHTSNHNPNHISPYINQPIIGYGHYGNPYWGPHGPYFPFLY